MEVEDLAGPGCWPGTGLEKGCEQGLETGRASGQGALLSRQLAHRFGALPTWAEQQLQAATTQQLAIRADRVLDATSLQQVFSDS